MVNFSKILIASAAIASVTAAPISRRDAKPFTKSNGEEAIALNQKFQTLKAGAACSASDGVQCAKDSLAQCVGGKIVVSACAGGTVCRALPLVNKAGTSVSCDTEADATKRIADTGATKAAKLPEASASTAEESSKEDSTATSEEEEATATSEEATTSVKATSSAKATITDKTSTQAAAGAKPFTKSNGEAAIALNEKFQTVKAGAACSATDGVQCSKDSLAQCVNGKIVVSACASGTVCRALPLVNSAGTSVTCDTAADAEKRIADTGATKAGKETGSSASASSAEVSDTATATSEKATATEKTKTAEKAKTEAASDAKPFTLSNGKAAIELNNKFKDIKAGQKCTFTEPQCASDKLANCLAGKVVTQSCGTGTVCRALPLVNKAGTSVTCDTAADADARIAATGASTSDSASTPDSKNSEDKEKSEVDNTSEEEDKSSEEEVSEEETEETEENADEDKSSEETATEDEDTTEEDDSETASEETAAEDDSETASEETTAEKTASENDSASEESKADTSAAPAAPAAGAKPFTLSNGQDAITLNKKFQDIKEGSACTSTDVQCAGDKLANCVAGKIVVSACSAGTVCRALPLVNKAGTSVTCDTAADALARIAATGAKA